MFRKPSFYPLNYEALQSMRCIPEGTHRKDSEKSVIGYRSRQKWKFSPIEKVCARAV